MITKEELAHQITGSAYPFHLPPDLALAAKLAGIVVVYGASDDLMELQGAVSEEYDAYEGREILLTKEGVFDEQACRDHCAYYRHAKRQAETAGQPLKALWDTEGYSWLYETAIPHVTFDITEEGEPYCRGIIFALADV